MVAVITSSPQVVGCLWGLLFFGGACVPGATCIFVAAVPLELRPLATSFAVVLFNLLGCSSTSSPAAGEGPVILLHPTLTSAGVSIHTGRGGPSAE